MVTINFLQGIFSTTILKNTLTKTSITGITDSHDIGQNNAENIEGTEIKFYNTIWDVHSNNVFFV